METSVESDRGCACENAGSDPAWKALWNTIRKPCLTVNFDLQMQVYSDYDTAPQPATVKNDSKQRQPAAAQSAQPLCDKSEAGCVKWRIVDMVSTIAAVSVVMSMLCCVKRLCARIK